MWIKIKIIYITIFFSKFGKVFLEYIYHNL